jgi:uncharacterized protein
MTTSGRPRDHDIRADEIRQAISQASCSDAMALVRQAGLEVLDGESRTPLCNAAIVGNLEILSWLISEGANVNHQERNGLSALHFAVQNRHPDLILCLLQSGALIDIPDRYGNSPLWRAVFDARGKYDIVSLLVSKGAKTTSRNTSGRSPLDFAKQIGDDILITMLQNG